MTTHEEILRLFKSLTENERSSLLEKLSQTTSIETEVIENAEIVCCPHCESRTLDPLIVNQAFEL